MFNTFSELNGCVLKCRLCPRLVHFRETVPPKKAFADEIHHRQPVPGFGDPEAQVLIVGLAPSVDGGNRTGRIFTGDPSADFLMPLLFEEGFASQPYSQSLHDGLTLFNCYITAAVKCVPPMHKPLKEERENCSRYYQAELQLLKRVTCVVALGKFAFDAHVRYLKDQEVETHDVVFKHGASYSFKQGPSLIASYHPSPQNTQTGKLTATMFKHILQTIKRDLQHHDTSRF